MLEKQRTSHETSEVYQKVHDLAGKENVSTFGGHRGNRRGYLGKKKKAASRDKNGSYKEK